MAKKKVKSSVDTINASLNVIYDKTPDMITVILQKPILYNYDLLIGGIHFECTK